MKLTSTRWDIFCRIVDNYGDIGVCWRLSQQLASEYGLHIRLLIDDLTVAQKIIPGLNADATDQTIHGVEISPFHQPQRTPSAVVIETFSCGLPEPYIAQMHELTHTWINLEYLSAEDWVSAFHAKPSKHPSLPLTKHYFFPGFNETTGGLIREQGLIQQREAFLSNAILQSQFWHNLGVTDKVDALKISLFHYPEANLQYFLQALEQSALNVRVVVPVHDNTYGRHALFKEYDWDESKRLLTKGHVSVHLIPFLSQNDYDHLLWSCDLNFVRGEDSWIRAIWAGKPFIWQPYRQADAVHMTKLNAFLQQYSQAASPALGKILQDAHVAWSDPFATQTEPWQSLIAQLPQIQAYAAAQSNTLATQPDLATKLVFFSEKLTESRV